MPFPMLKNNKGYTDIVRTITLLAGLAAVIKFLLDGVTLVVYGHTIDFGHMDSLSYATLLAPILGAHGYLESKSNKQEKKPDANQV